MPNIELKKITKTFTSINEATKGEIITAVDNASLKIKKYSYNTLLGPSGCGKTTLLRMISGLENPTEGKVFFDKKDVTNMPTQERDIGFVFQNYSLFPHMDIWHNVSYGPIVRNKFTKETEKYIHSILKMVKLDERAKAYPNELSGGMKQRVAVARAIATKSPLMLLDEPLGALDVRIGTALRYDLMKLVKKYKLTAIHVTHNQEEAMTISDNIIMMKRGKVIQSGSPKEIYKNPNSIFSAYFLGRCNFFQCEMIDKNTANFQGTIIKLPKNYTRKKVVLGVRGEKIHINNILKRENIQGTIEFINFLGEKWQYIIRLSDGTEISALKRTPHKAKIRQKVSISFYADNILIFNKPKDFESEKSV
ncbi:MAG: ABC transporter ATP-binding protein [Candidatus Pacebacteria bacterium]|nr:ABC transporter ATP-binding protein [Candidatus Paceibacterota bacterium]